MQLGIHPITGHILAYLSEGGYDMNVILWAVTDFLELLKRARKEVVMNLTLPKNADKQYQDYLINHLKNEHNLHDSKLEISVEV